MPASNVPAFHIKTRLRQLAVMLLMPIPASGNPPQLLTQTAKQSCPRKQGLGRMRRLLARSHRGGHPAGGPGEELPGTAPCFCHPGATDMMCTLHA